MSSMLAPVQQQPRQSPHYSFQILIRTILFCGLCLGLCPGQAKALDSHQLIERSRSLNLSKSRQWNRLNHYRRTWWGAAHSTIRSTTSGDFFIHPQGSESPQAELEQTIEKMFSQSPELRHKTQCKYLARREFIATALNIAESDLEACEFSADWIKRLGAQQVSLIFASSFMNSAGSSFGHTFLKLHNPENQGALELTDYGVNYSARTTSDDGAMYAINGLLGNFPGSFSMLPFHQMMKGYLNLEGRDLWEYRLSLGPLEVRRILYALLELEGAYFDYYFLDDNCSFHILQLLEIAKPDLELIADDEFFVIPLDTVKRVQSVSGLVTSLDRRPSLQTQFRARLVAGSGGFSRESLAKILEAVEGSNSASAIGLLSTAELDLTQYYLALKQVETSSDLRAVRDRVARARAKRLDNAENSPPSVPSAPAPHTSPDSTSVGVGAFEKSQLKGPELYWRFAFHDLLQRDEGAAKWSELEVLSFRVRNDTTMNKSYLDEFRLLSMLSTSAVNILFQPMSWGVRVGAMQNGEDLNHLSGHFQIKAGTSLDLWPGNWNQSQLRWSLFVKGTAQETPDTKYGFGVGGETFLLANFWDRARTQLGFEKQYYSKWDFQSTQFRMILDITRSLELVAESKELLWAPVERSVFWTQDKVVRLQYQFLY